jgi:hypothetical protein
LLFTHTFNPIRGEDMKMVKSLLLGLSCAGMLFLGACATDGGGSTTDPATKDANVSAVIAAIQKGCGFVAYAPTIAALIGNSVIIDVADFANLVCSKVTQVQTARRGVNRDVAVVINGVTVRGHFGAKRSSSRLKR